MRAIIFLSNLIVLALISFSLRYIYNNCNNTYVHLIEQPVETIAQLESPFFFKCLGILIIMLFKIYTTEIYPCRHKVRRKLLMIHLKGT